MTKTVAFLSCCAANRGKNLFSLGCIFARIHEKTENTRIMPLLMMMMMMVKKEKKKKMKKNELQWLV